MAIVDSNSFQKMRIALSLMRQGQAATLLAQIRKQAMSDELCYGFRRDLAEAFNPPPSLIPIRLRPFETRDRQRLFGFTDKFGFTGFTNKFGQDGKAMLDRLRRLSYLDAGMPTPYVAVTDDDTPCFIQWLITPGSNAFIGSYFNGYFPRLAEDEVMVEGVFIPEHYRGKRIMAAAMSRLARKGAELGARFATTYTQSTDLPTINGCLAAGFRPHSKRVTKWRRFAREVQFSPLTADERREVEAPWNTLFSGATTPHDEWRVPPPGRE